MLKVTAVSHPGIYNFFINLKNTTKSPDILELYIVPNTLLNGTTVNKKIIKLSDSLVDIYNTHPHVVHYMLAHEFIHYIHKEYRTPKNAFIRVGAIVGIRHMQAVVLLQEIRAAIDGNRLAKLTQKQIQDSQIHLHRVNKNDRKQISYKEYGYPSRVQIIKFSKKYPIYNQNTANEILDDYIKVLKLKKYYKTLAIWLLNK
ncbi:hypothetical protein M5X11_16180 [Paenibacillus alginolyticus]|uniref:hypothetical protein n=1 Tax=Paenibacillus alginolyticus TaxID=59839 RepID=UPI0004923D77|nr:hypothetical protein [Paenibacillus alginolyticus]MCY9666482.1 hypothetical protein [Paenibacillus alginolyticus]